MVDSPLSHTAFFEEDVRERRLRHTLTNHRIALFPFTPPTLLLIFPVAGVGSSWYPETLKCDYFIVVLVLKVTLGTFPINLWIYSYTCLFDAEK